MTGNELKAIRLNLGWTQQDMATHLGIWRHTVGLYEKKADQEVPLSRIMDLAFTSSKVRAQAVEMSLVCDRAAEFIESEIGVYENAAHDFGKDDFEQWKEKLTKLLADVKSVSDRLKFDKFEA